MNDPTTDPPAGNRDTCACKCAYLNGLIQLVVAQIFLFAAAALSLATIADCKFLKANISGVDEDDHLATLLPNGGSRGLGFFTFEGNDGDCYFYNNEEDYPFGVDREDVFESYMDFLGSHWMAARVLGCIAAALGWILWFYALSYICSAQIRLIRYLTGAFCCVALATFQGITFIAFNSRVCDGKSCDFSRGAGLSVGALLCFFFGGIPFFLTKDYDPGERQMPAVAQPAVSKPAVAYPVQQEYPPQDQEEINMESGVMEGQEENIEVGVTDGKGKESQTSGTGTPLQNVILE